MSVGIGVDTGGTYTDAVVFDFDTQSVLAKGKAQTTHGELTVGIGAALDQLPADLLRQATVVALSTTLATNASVEGKGGRAKLLLLGTTRDVLSWIKADSRYGLRAADLCCRNTKSTFDGKVVDEPDWHDLWRECDATFSDADVLSVVEVCAVRNGGVLEKAAAARMTERYRVPVVSGVDLVDGLNMMERGATALLNARLLPVIESFLAAVEQALAQRGIEAPVFVVRSDSSLMAQRVARQRPVETVLSGPAASVLGAGTFASEVDNLVVDMGGTTTDISLVRDGRPVMATDGIRIGDWRTQVQGVYVDTFALGGDSAIRVRQGELELQARRVEPLCAAAVKWPSIVRDLRRLMAERRFHSLPLHEFLYLVREPGDRSRFEAAELRLCDRLKAGPCMIGHLSSDLGLDIYGLDSERLEREGIVMRCGLTPTDLMHVRGDYRAFDVEAAELGVRAFLGLRAEWPDDAAGLAAFVEAGYEAVQHKLFRNIVRILMSERFPELQDLDDSKQLSAVIDEIWRSRNAAEADRFLEFTARSRATLVGIGAPTHLFLPEVAKVLGTQCLLPEHGEVANAIGAVRADIAAVGRATIRSEFNDGEFDYSVHAADLVKQAASWDEAYRIAREVALRLAETEARRRGALGELSVDTDHEHKVLYGTDGTALDLGGEVVTRVSGRLAG